MQRRDVSICLVALVAGLTLTAVTTPTFAKERRGQPPIERPAADSPTSPENAAAQPHASEAAPPSRARLAPPPWPEPIWLVEASPFQRRGEDGGGGRQRGRERGGERNAADDHRSHEREGGRDAAAASGRQMEMDGDMSGMGEMSGRGKTAKTLELKRGADPADSAAAALSDRSALQILAADGKRWTTPFAARAGQGARTKVELEDFGFYNAAVVQKTVRDGVLDVQIAQAELLKGAMAHGGHSKHDPSLFKATTDDSAPFELIREHQPKEMLWTTIRSGEKASYLVRSYGKPVAGARVTLATQQGWRKSVRTDADGRAEFSLIRDYFPDWSDFNRRQTGLFLVWAEVEKPESGALEGQTYSSARYQASLTGRYYPSPSDYTSYGYAIGLIVFMTSVTAFAVWFYRQRRATPYKEVVFDEKLA